MVPGTVMYVYIGALVGDIAALDRSADIDPHAQIVQWVVRGVGLIATLGVTLCITHLAKRALNTEISSTS